MYDVITGSLSGIGKETLTYLAKKKHNLIACIEKESTEFNSFIENLAAENDVSIKTLSFDLNSEESIKEAAKKLKSFNLKLSSLINIAGITKDSSVLMTSQKDIKLVNNINLFSQILFTQYFIKITQNSEQLKSIVFISSISALDGIEGMISYGTSKAGLINACKVFSRELGRKNFRFNTIAPGVINTAMNKIVPEDILSKRINSTSLKRIGEPVEVAKVIEFLISEKSSFITGQVFRVDGGIG